MLKNPNVNHSILKSILRKLTVKSQFHLKLILSTLAQRHIKGLFDWVDGNISEIFELK